MNWRLISMDPAAHSLHLRFYSSAVETNATVGLSAHTLFTSQIMGNCAGFQVWPTLASNSLNLQDIFYGYGPMPATPDTPGFDAVRDRIRRETQI